MGKSIVVYNELIAEFMQYERNRLKYYIPNMAGMNQEGVYTNKFYSEELRFHLSWDWLMKVIEKIVEFCSNNDMLDEYHKIIDSIPNISETHKKVVQFIEEYNKKQWEDEHK